MDKKIENGDRIYFNKSDSAIHDGRDKFKVESDYITQNEIQTPSDFSSLLTYKEALAASVEAYRVLNELYL